MYQLTHDQDRVICLETMAEIPRGHYLWEEYEEWLAAGNTPAPVPLPYELHSPQHHLAIRSSAWDWMTAWVKKRRYDSIESCCSYFNSSVPRYRDEARAMVAWRDSVNQALEALVLAAPRGVQTWEQVQALLPQPEDFAWPSEMELPLSSDESAVLA
ncbi:hypothetical protein [Stenotrophomonas maltophilia]|uniref:hypothetical protein n=1 Tax=Stenotrophomonas maltophilia TaxID=40324 RepID=UPI0007EF81EF|nr:hypothetical protein [Stenotrophomonas maltophilia]OBU55128.1 hypothetical protein A9K69_01505 [Stenotrophomonas maltophilia]